MRQAKSILLIFSYIFAMFLLPYLSMYGLIAFLRTEDFAFLQVMTNFISYLFLLIIVILLFRHELVADFKKIPSTKSFVKGIAVGWLILYGCLIVSNVLMLYVFHATDSSANQQMIEDIMKVYPTLMAVTTIFFAPIVEEVVFRYTIMSRFKNAPYIGIAISSILFGFIHVISAGDFIYSIPYVMMGVALGYTYYKNQNIWYSIGVHFIQNLFSTLILIFSLFM